jgi:hypothetical protein
MTHERIYELVEPLLEAALTISRHLGYEHEIVKLRA